MLAVGVVGVAWYFSAHPPLGLRDIVRMLAAA
jgi:hypothetical protein